MRFISRCKEPLKEALNRRKSCGVGVQGLLGLGLVVCSRWAPGGCLRVRTCFAESVLACIGAF